MLRRTAIPPVRSVLIYPREDGHARTTLLDAVEYLRAQGVTVVVPSEVDKVEGADGVARALLDLPYAEDSRAAVDLNVVMLASGGLIEVQGTGERSSFSRAQLDVMLDLAERGVASLAELQRAAIGAGR